MRILPPDNIAYYQCDVSKWEEVEAVSKKIIEEVYCFTSFMDICSSLHYRSVNPLCSLTTLALHKENSSSISNQRMYTSMSYCISFEHWKLKNNFQDIWCEYPGPFLDLEGVLTGDDQKQNWPYCEFLRVSG